MARPRAAKLPVHLRTRMLDVDEGALIEPGGLLVDGGRIVEVRPPSVPDGVVVDLGDLTLLPGLINMEVNLLMGGPDHHSPLVPVQDDPTDDISVTEQVRLVMKGGRVYRHDAGISGR